MLLKLSLKNIGRNYSLCPIDAWIVLLPKYVKEIINSSRRHPESMLFFCWMS